MKPKLQLRPKYVALILISLIILTSISLMITFIMSDGNKTAMDAVFQSSNVEKNIGKVEKIILTGSSSKYSGSFGCADFRYLVFGEAGMKIVNVRVEKTENSKKSWKVLELVEGLGSEFHNVCWRKD